MTDKQNRTVRKHVALIAYPSGKEGGIPGDFAADAEDPFAIRKSVQQRKQACHLFESKPSVIWILHSAAYCVPIGFESFWIAVSTAPLVSNSGNTSGFETFPGG